jgi:hypothetical protein
MADPLSKYIGDHLQTIRIKRNMTQAEDQLLFQA